MNMNPYQGSLQDIYGVAASAAESDRVSFIRQTYLHLAGAIMAFAVIEAVVFTLVPSQTILQFVGTVAGPWTWLLFLGGFMVVSWVARSWAESSASLQKQYMGLILFVVAEAVLFVPILAMAQFACADPHVIKSAGIITMIVFGGLTLVVFGTKADFSFLRMFLFWGGILAVGIMILGMMFQGFSLGIWFSVAMIALASGYILYDTSNILHHYRTDQYVAASLALFASVAVLFWYVLRLLMTLSSRD